MPARNVHRLAKPMRWAARVIALILTIFGATMLIGAAISDFLSQGSVTTSLEGSTLVLIGLVALAGLVLSWWKDLPSGILLVATSVGLGIHIGICAGHNHIMAWAILGLPYLVAGVLLLYAWRLSRHNF
jgi:hypothetical protein